MEYAETGTVQECVRSATIQVRVIILAISDNIRRISVESSVRISMKNRMTRFGDNINLVNKSPSEFAQLGDKNTINLEDSELM